MRPGSIEAWHNLVGRFRELGFDEFIFPEPEPHEMAVFEHVVATEMPRYRPAPAESSQLIASTAAPMNSSSAEWRQRATGLGTLSQPA